MSREKLLDISSKFLAWVNTRGADPAELKSIVADDLVLKIPYPGQTPNLAGLLENHKMACTAASDFKLTLLKAVVDEVECTVVHFLECSGTHEAYYLSIQLRANFSEWSGIPATGKKFSFLGFAMMKVLLLGECTDHRLTLTKDWSWNIRPYSKTCICSNNSVSSPGLPRPSEHDTQLERWEQIFWRLDIWTYIPTIVFRNSHRLIWTLVQTKFVHNYGPDVHMKLLLPLRVHKGSFLLTPMYSNGSYKPGVFPFQPLNNIPKDCISKSFICECLFVLKIYKHRT